MLQTHSAIVGATDVQKPRLSLCKKKRQCRAAGPEPRRHTCSPRLVAQGGAAASAGNRVGTLPHRLRMRWQVCATNACAKHNLSSIVWAPGSPKPSRVLPPAVPSLHRKAAAEKSVGNTESRQPAPVAHLQTSKSSHVRNTIPGDRTTISSSFNQTSPPSGPLAAAPGVPTAGAAFARSCTIICRREGAAAGRPQGHPPWRA